MKKETQSVKGKKTKRNRKQTQETDRLMGEREKAREGDREIN